ncbi:MAG: fibronectin type III domain-containing protein [Deltaproteobacteria bacterium]|nr:fibronectin type III domain-containing protein [Deltaproteobacteria bacterium]
MRLEKSQWLSLVFLGLSCFATVESLADNSLSLQYKAWTSNAGGQDAYSLRWSVDDSYEWTLFSNHLLTSGSYPLTGLLWDVRFPICGHSCVIGVWAQAGAGLSTAGPVVEFLWSFRFFWLLRVDMATHLYFSQLKPIVWSYPFWIGISLPF